MLSNEFGCFDQSLTLVIVGDPTVVAPTGFSPNGDGINDRWKPFTVEAAVVESLVQIFNRWGELVYEGYDLPVNDRSVGWDGSKKGKISPSGLYYWSAEVEYLNGQTEIFKGNTTLIR